MAPEERAAYINSQVACALIELASMQAANTEREHRGYSPAYPEGAFLELLNKYPIGHNQAISFLREEG